MPRRKQNVGEKIDSILNMKHIIYFSISPFKIRVPIPHLYNNFLT